MDSSAKRYFSPGTKLKFPICCHKRFKNKIYETNSMRSDGNFAYYCKISYSNELRINNKLTLAEKIKQPLETTLGSFATIMNLQPCKEMQYLQRETGD